MASLLERLLGDDEPDEQVDIDERRERADEALREAVVAAGGAAAVAGSTASAATGTDPPIDAASGSKTARRREAPERNIYMR